MRSVPSRLIAAGILVLTFGLAWAAPALAQKKVALVIGNSTYKEQPLKNPANDARAMAAKLRQIGFQVIARENATKTQMEKAVADFGEALNAGAIGLFYYAGHGLQVSGRNFLVPVDASITAEQRVRLETMDVDVVLDQMEAAKSAVNLVILDACRNNPFERRFRAAGGGLAQINAPQGTLIAYATAPGRVAADGEGANGLYTSKLLQHLGAPGLPVEEVFKRVRIDVAKETGNNQTPWESSSLTGSFFFVEPQVAAAPAPAPVAAAPVPAAPAVDKEAMFWSSVQDSDDPAVLQSYLTQYANGTFAAAAKAKIASLERRRQEQEQQRKLQLAAAPAPAAPPAAMKGSGNRAFDGRWNGKFKCAATPRLPAFEVDKPFLIEDGLIVLARGSEGMQEAGAYSAMQGTIDERGQVALTGEGARAATGEFKIRLVGRFDGDRGMAGGTAFAVADPGKARACTFEATRDRGATAAAGAPPIQQAAALAPAPAAPSRALTAGAVDGTWQGSYSCGPGGDGQPGFDSPGRIFSVAGGSLSGKFSNNRGADETYTGSISPDGTVTISGNGTDSRSGKTYVMSMQGKVEDGRFTAKGRHGNRDCTLTYAKIR